MDNKYYSLDEIKKKKDLDGLEPSIYIINTNRSAGKTTAVLKESLDNYKKNGKQTILIYRYRYELSASHLIYTDVLHIYRGYGDEMTANSNAQGLFYTLMLDGEVFGYALALSNIDSLKKYSPLFADVTMCLFDEFQKEDSKYLPNEVEKLQSLLVTIARGGGTQARDIKVYMLANMVSIINPYFIKFGIHKRIKKDTRFLRGKGWVAEFGFNENAVDEMRKTGMFRAFQNDSYMEYMTENKYLLDSNNFIEKPNGKNKYIATITKNGKLYGVLDFYEKNILYVTNRVDNSCRNILAFNANEHGKNTIMLTRSSYTITMLKDAFYSGAMFFEDAECKNIIFDILALDKMRQ